MPELPQGVLERLQREETAWLCTLRPDGSPHLTPVWFLFRNSTWWVASARRSRKVRNLVTDARVSLALQDGSAPVVAEGVAVLHDGDFPEDVVRGLAEKYRGWTVTAQEPDGPRVLLQIAVVRWLLIGAAQ